MTTNLQKAMQTINTIITNPQGNLSGNCHLCRVSKASHMLQVVDPQGRSNYHLQICASCAAHLNPVFPKFST